MMILALRRGSGGDDVVDSRFCPGGYIAWRDVEAARAGIEADAAQRGLTLTWMAPTRAEARDGGGCVEVWQLVARTAGGMRLA
jgi:hypothetical protein